MGHPRDRFAPGSTGAERIGSGRAASSTSDILSRDERLHLLKIICAFVGADRAIDPHESRFVARMIDLLELDAEGRQEVEGWLAEAPDLDSVDLTRVSLEHHLLFLDSISAAIFADGAISAEERRLFQKLRR